MITWIRELVDRPIANPAGMARIMIINGAQARRWMAFSFFSSGWAPPGIPELVNLLWYRMIIPARRTRESVIAKPS
jgi:hypothetical protein